MTKPKPVYLLAGGKWSSRRSPDPLIQAVFKESGRPQPSVAYIGTASGDDKGFFERIARVFKDAGAGKVNHALIFPDKADLLKARRILASADIIFISGGDVYEGIQVLRGKKIVDFIDELYRQGKVFFGLSAGSIMLAKKWVYWSDPDNDSSATLFPCLNLASVLCDTHSEEDNWEELQVALRLAEDGEKGYGIVSGAALKVYSDNHVEAMAIGRPIHQFVRRKGKIIRGTDILPVL